MHPTETELLTLSAFTLSRCAVATSMGRANPFHACCDSHWPQLEAGPNETVDAVAAQMCQLEVTALSTLMRAARRAGMTAAAIPASAAMTVITASCPAGMVTA